MTKKTFLDQLRRWRKDKEEQYARVTMERPERSTILKLFCLPDVTLILGKRRGGKTATAHRIAEAMNKSRGVRAMVHLPSSTSLEIRRRIQKLLPDYMKVTTNKDQWEKNSVVIYDEAAQTAHARRTQSGDAVELDNLMGISGQRNQFLIFICHHSKKLDPNVIREVNHIIWKQPTYAYQLFERDELADFTMKAFDFFAELRKGRKLNDTIRRTLKRNNLVLDLDDFRFFSFDNSLPQHWTEKLSNLFEDINKVGRQAPGY
ncbi:MAG: ATP-binding protein [Deltaproteobacteria bacterium]|nr:ATP-binding protein [Deltaproteobacteria bacterium]